MVQRLVRAGTWRMTRTAFFDASVLGYDQDGVKDVVLGFTAVDFYKTMAAERVPGLMQDVYRPVDRGVSLYVKVQIVANTTTVVISFKGK
jgi:hypothetical protein